MPPIENTSGRVEPNETISQSEVEALLAEVGASPESPSGAKKRSKDDPNALERYDFNQVSFFSARELRKLRVRHEEFIRALSARLAVYLRLEVSLQMSKLETMQFQKFTEGLSNPTHLTLMKIEPLQGICLMDLSPRLGLCIVDRELGGPGICNEDVRDLSLMETRLLSKVIEIILGEWCTAWGEMGALRPTILGHENTGRFLQTSLPGCMMLIVGVQARMGDLSEQMTFAFPYQAIEPMMLKMDSGLESNEKPTPAQPAPSARWNRLLDDVKLTVAAELPEMKFTAKRLAQLKPGDVLPIPIDVTSRVRVRLGKSPKFIANLGTCDQRWALKLEKLLESPKGKPAA